MKNLFKLFIGFLIILGASTTNAQTKADSLLNATLKKSKAVGLLAGYTKDGVKWTSATGSKSKDQSITIETPTRIASVTKIMTAVAIMQLKEKGLIDLDEPISSYYDQAGSLHEKITICQLLTHSSGIRAYKSSKERENKTNYESLEEAYAIVKNDKLVENPATIFSYTSYGYVLLGILIEKVSGMRYEDYMRENIWSPLSMENTGIEYETIQRMDLSDLYHKSGKGKVKAVARTNITDRIPGGGVYSTVDDMLNFGEGLLAAELISEGSLNEMMTDSGFKKQGNPYGFGLYLYGINPKVGNIVGHSGTQIGASVQFMLLPEQNAVVFTASNTSGIWEDVFYLNVQLFSLLGSEN